METVTVPRKMLEAWTDARRRITEADAATLATDKMIEELQARRAHSVRLASVAQADVDDAARLIRRELGNVDGVSGWYGLADVDINAAGDLVVCMDDGRDLLIVAED